MRIRMHGKMWEVNLADEAQTLDAIVEVQLVTARDTAENRVRKRAGLPAVDFWPVQDVRFADTSDYRNEDGSFTKDGFRKLALEAIEDYLFDDGPEGEEYAFGSKSHSKTLLTSTSPNENDSPREAKMRARVDQLKREGKLPSMEQFLAVMAKMRKKYRHQILAARELGPEPEEQRRGG